MDDQRDVIAVDEQVYNVIDYFTNHPFLLMGFGVGSGLLIACMSVGILLDNKFISKGEN